MSPATCEKLQSLSRPLPSAGQGLHGTELFPKRVDVNAANDSRLGDLRTQLHCYPSGDWALKLSRKEMLKLLNETAAPPEIKLRTGAQVMLVRNLDETRHLVNGTIGRVCGFFQAQIGDGHEGVLRDIKLDGDGRLLPTVPAVKAGQEGAPAPKLTWDKYPYVQFFTPCGPVSVLVTLDEFKVEDAQGEVIARRVQVPLILSWAISVHKSQGQTLQRVKVDLSHVFAPG